MSMDLPPLPVPTITLEDLEGIVTPVSDDHDDKYGVPSLDELGQPFLWHCMCIIVILKLC